MAGIEDTSVLNLRTIPSANHSDDFAENHLEPREREALVRIGATDADLTVYALADRKGRVRLQTAIIKRGVRIGQVL